MPSLYKMRLCEHSVLVEEAANKIYASFFAVCHTSEALKGLGPGFPSCNPQHG